MFNLSNLLCGRVPPLARCCSTGQVARNSELMPVFSNRNPRNLEKLRIAYKPDGYHVDAPGKSYWHKLHVRKTGRYAYAHIEHFENGIVVKASTNEWAIKKQLYRYNDTAAFMNLGRVLAQRCLESGLTEVHCDIKAKNEQGQLGLFLKALKDGGLHLEEPPQYKNPQPWDQHRPEKPWEIQ